VVGVERIGGTAVTGAIDSGLDFFRHVLDLRGYRQQILSADIANASTPGFKAVDLDFRQALGAAGVSGAAGPRAPAAMWLVDDARQIAPATGAAAAGAAAAVKYQSGGAVTLDGNSVDLDREKVAAAENAVQYEAAATFASQMIKMMTTAINGSGGGAAPGG
jgi:flagellar basal-body rod protein FlgB